MRTKEIPLVINCEGAPQIGIYHQPEQSRRIGIVIVVAGGPQYRVGCARQLILWCRRLASEGFPVIRFDYRGFGDSGGRFKGFEHINEDIKTVIDKLMELAPEVEEIVLWGECNAASSIMMYAWSDKRVKRLVMQNPWVRDEVTQARTYIRHYYLMRIMQKSFWVKLFKFKFNPLISFSSMFRLWQKGKQIGSTNSEKKVSDLEKLSTYQEKMREGFAFFSGKSLLFMSGYSLIGKEFDELVSISERWQQIMSMKEITRIDEPDADHTFSRFQDSENLINNAVKWLKNAE